MRSLPSWAVLLPVTISFGVQQPEFRFPGSSGRVRKGLNVFCCRGGTDPLKTLLQHWSACVDPVWLSGAEYQEKADGTGTGHSRNHYSAGFVAWNTGIFGIPVCLSYDFVHTPGVGNYALS